MTDLATKQEGVAPRPKIQWQIAKCRTTTYARARYRPESKQQRSDRSQDAGNMPPPDPGTEPGEGRGAFEKKAQRAHTSNLEFLDEARLHPYFLRARRERVAL